MFIGQSHTQISKSIDHENEVTSDAAYMQGKISENLKLFNFCKKENRASCEKSAWSRNNVMSLGFMHTHSLTLIFHLIQFIFLCCGRKQIDQICPWSTVLHLQTINCPRLCSKTTCLTLCGSTSLCSSRRSLERQAMVPLSFEHFQKRELKIARLLC